MRDDDGRMHGHSETAPGETAPGETAPGETPPPRRRTRRLRAGLLAAVPVLLLAGTAGAFWTGYRLYDQPFVRFNLNRIAAVADKAARTPGAVTVVALGNAALRHATPDEGAMAALAARHGVERLHFLRIVHDHAQFADFEPMIGEILDLKPDLVLLDLDLLFTERSGLAGLRRYGAVLAGALREGKPYLRDQLALQYDRPCDRPAGTSAEGGALEPRLEAWRDTVVFSAESPSFERVRRFADQARAGGVRVALLHLRWPPAVEQRLYGPGNSYLPGALDRLKDAPGLPLWRVPDSVHSPADRTAGGAAGRAEHRCADGMPGPEGRQAHASWLAATIAEALSAPPVEEAALQ